MQPYFPASDQKSSVPKDEETIQQYWKDHNIFQRSIDERSKEHEYRFFDGPPFATGLPHYGHMIGGTIKDAIPRYWTMKGYRVNRRFGWDCHGLPVEFLVEKEEGIKGKPEIEKLGVGKFNELCRSKVFRCSDDWKKTVDRMGRFVDMEDDYKTMDVEFMESVWWVFGQMWDKGYVYEGEKVLAYSPKLSSPLSNMEANLNYKDIDDPAVTVCFKLKHEAGSIAPDEYVLAWTTTPWTLPSNVGLGFGKNHNYVLVEFEEHLYWIAEGSAARYFGEEYEEKVINKRKGIDFKGISYEPLFPFFGNDEAITRYECVHDAGDYITTGEGTGIVHFAPAFGEDDAKVCDRFQLYGINPINDEGYFEFKTTNTTRKGIPALVRTDVPELAELDGRYFRADEEVDGSKENNANDWVIEHLKDQGSLFKREQIRHSYPHCWRTDCALMYRGVKTWFIEVSKVKDRMIELNQDINWIPSHVKDGRFGKILEGAPDWAISRNRYWGTPIPIWRCDKTNEIQVVRSARELSELAGTEVTDIHKHFVDEYTWENKKTGGTMRRIPEVFDCWVESGSMPYASMHFPYEQKQKLIPDNTQDTSYVGQCPISKDQLFNNDFYVVRHGEAESNIIGIDTCKDQTQQKYGLTELGISTVKANAIKYDDFDLIFTSPFRRTKETAALFSKTARCKIIEDERLRENDCGIFDGEKYEKTTAFIKENFEDGLDLTFPDGESIRDVKKRLKDFFLDINQKHNGKKILIVSHGSPINFIFQMMRGEQVRFALESPLPEKGRPVRLRTEYIPQNHFQSADFIAEGMDQTRCWFYVLHVLGCALFDKTIYKNVVTNGIVLAEDGQKMSKSKQNYPAPEIIFDKYGADAMRFYMMQSPAVHGENLRFAEHGVEEVLKTIILPIKSAYNFLSTYANIDSWKPTKFVTIRHGEADHNVAGIYSGNIMNEHHLTQKGINSAKASAEKLESLDVLYSSPFVRTRETAEIVAKKQDLEIIYDDRLSEIDFGPELEGNPYIPIPQRHNNNGTESHKSVHERVASFVSEMSTKHAGKTIGVVSHGGPLRQLHKSVLGNISNLEDYLRTPPAPFGIPQSDFALPNPKTDLDQYILSELSTLLKTFEERFDAYDIEGGLRLIAPFIDKLNNWYLRRSRNRFWSTGMNEQKISGYETLHFVLQQLSKILAPVMPFFAEKLYLDLGGSDSVHLSFFNPHRPAWINTELEDKTNIIRSVVSLAAGIRARAKIKLRQPLGTLRFALVNKIKLSENDLEVMAQEANVKKIEILDSTEGIAKQIIKVDAKKVGRKFGKKTQQLISEGKLGNFNMKEDGVCLLCDEVLTMDEYEVGFLTEEGIEAEATREVVVLLDTEINDELKIEGYARELIRAIQETRKNNGFEISDRIEIGYKTDSEVLKAAFQRCKELIKNETLAEKIEIKEGGEEMQVDGEKIEMMVKKA